MDGPNVGAVKELAHVYEAGVLFHLPQNEFVIACQMSVLLTAQAVNVCQV